MTIIPLNMSIGAVVTVIIATRIMPNKILTMFLTRACSMMISN
mgnify:CR=1 FL=1